MKRVLALAALGCWAHGPGVRAWPTPHWIVPGPNPGVLDQAWAQPACLLFPHPPRDPLGVDVTWVMCTLKGEGQHRCLSTWLPWFWHKELVGLGEVRSHCLASSTTVVQKARAGTSSQGSVS